MVSFLRWRERRAADIHVDEDIDAYLDGELTTLESERIERHLRWCQRCQEAVGEARLARSLLRALPGVRPPRAFFLAEPVRQASSGVPFLVLSRAAAAVAVLFIASLVWSYSLGAMPATSRTADGRAGNLAAPQQAASPLLSVTPSSRDAAKAAAPMAATSASQPTPAAAPAPSQAPAAQAPGAARADALPTFAPPATTSPAKVAEQPATAASGAALAAPSPTTIPAPGVAAPPRTTAAPAAAASAASPTATAPAAAQRAAEQGPAAPSVPESTSPAAATPSGIAPVAQQPPPAATVPRPTPQESPALQRASPLASSSSVTEQGLSGRGTEEPTAFEAARTLAGDAAAALGILALALAVAATTLWVRDRRLR